MATNSVRSPYAVTRRVYIGIGLLVALIAIVGFWSSYFGPLILTGTVDTVPIIHFHAAIYSGWVLLFIAQIVFAYTGRLPLHRRLGKIGIGYGVVIIIVGVATALSRFTSRVELAILEQAELPLAPIGPLTDMIVFPIFFGAAIAYRKRPEIHKRLMIVATTILLIAAVGRMTFLGDPVPLLIFLPIWYLPILIAMGHDYMTKRLVHPAYVAGLIGLFILRLRDYAIDSAVWGDISSWLATVVV